MVHESPNKIDYIADEPIWTATAATVEPTPMKAFPVVNEETPSFNLNLKKWLTFLL